MLSFALTCLALAAPAQEARTPPPATYARAIQPAADDIARGALERAQRALDAAEVTERGFEWSHLRLALDLARSASAAPGVRAAGRAPAASPAIRVAAISVLQGHAEACRAVAISSDGTRIVSSGRERVVRSWNARTGDLERVLSGAGGAITGLSFSPRGERVAAASEDGSVRVWDVLDGRVVLTLDANAGPLTALAWSPDGAWIASADAALAVRLWNPASGAARFALRGHAGPITSIAFSGDGKLLASSSEDGTLRICDVASGELARTLSFAKVAANACCFEPGDARIAVVLRDGTIRRFVVATGARGQVLAQQGGAVEALAFTSDGRRFATGTGQGAVQVWDVLGTLLLELHVSDSAIRGLAFDARATRLVACGDDRSVHVLETDVDRAREMQRGRVEPLPSLETASTMKPLEVEALCRRVVERAGLETRQYEEAEALARATFERLPASGQVHTTLGGALYRLDRCDEALAVLLQASEEKRGWPPNLAFRTLVLARLQRGDEARALLQRLETLMRESRWETDVEAHALLDEARAAVSASKPGAR